MITEYRVRVKYGYLAEFIFKAETFKEAGYIADQFLDNLVEPEASRITISIEPYKKQIEEDVEDEQRTDRRLP